MSTLEGLNEAQQEAVLHGEGPLLILAGAGSGKTRALTERLAHLLESGAARPEEILAITFTNKAAQEMRARVARRVPQAADRLWILTFHQASARILRREADRLGYPRDFAIYDTQDQLQVMRQVLGRMNLDEKRYPPSGILHRISKAKNELQTPDDVRAEGGFFEEQVARAFEGYQERLRQLGALDFDDLIGFVVHLMEEDQEVREHWQQRFRHLLVDEYQDTNLAQYRWVRALVGKRQNLAVVGDPDQSIYGWRGADIRNILEFEKDFPHARVVLLTENYRSTGRILKTANALIRPNRLRREKELWSALGEGEPVRVGVAQDEWQEGEWVGRRIEEVRRAGTPLSEIAVLYRTNAQSRSHEEALIRHAIPYRLVGGLRFYERLEIKDLLAYLRLVQNERDDLAFRRALNVPKRGLGPATLVRIEEIAAHEGVPDLQAARAVAAELPGKKGRDLKAFLDLIEELQSAKQSFTTSRLVEEVAERSGYLASLRLEGTVESQSRAENVESLINKAREAEAESPLLEDFLAKVALLSDVDEADAADGRVSVMTLHAAKGLEFDCVFLTGMEEGLLPHSRAAFEESELEEERRLFYVGVTRARKELWLLRALRRQRRGETVPSVASRFLQDLPRDAVEEVVLNGGAEHALPPGRRMSVSSYLGQPSAQVVVGDHVRHREFGEGTVVQLRENGDEVEVTVAFPSAGLRRLLARYAGLEKVGT
ncbi:MAG: UvrD-helicase domain-containing protein [Thermaerobacter sp.]|nr:UvrD-helicase domain-containing protein [Thermaerobacter sp.]